MSGGRATGFRAALAAVAIGAFVLRIIGLQYGLPSVYNPDEVAIMARALSFAKGTLNPENFLYPTFYFYVLFAWVGTYLGAVWLTGGVSSVAALQQLYFTDPTGIYTAGRALGAVTGTLAVLAVYRLGERLFDRWTAIAAAGFLAVAPLAVRDSHYVKHDVPATLAVVLACIAIVRIWPRHPPAGRHRHDVLIAGAACGAAFSTHYYCVFLALPLAWAVVQRWRPSGWRIVGRHLVTAGLTAMVVFFALSPFILVEPFVAWRDIVANRQIVIDRAIEAGAFAPARRYLEMLWHDSLGPPVIVLSLAGTFAMLLAHGRVAVLLLAFPLPFLAFISNTAPASRYLNPVLPFAALMAAWGITRFCRRLPAGGAAILLVVAACAVLPLRDSIRTGLFFRMDDTRTLAKRFIESNVPAGAGILLQPYSVSLTPSRAGLIEALSRGPGGVEGASTKFRLQLSLDPYPEPNYRLIWLGRGGLDAEKVYVDPADLRESPLERLRAMGVTFAILKRYNALDPELMPLLAELSRRGRLIAAFSPYRPGIPSDERARIEPFLHNTDTRIVEALERPGPPLEIWQLDGPDS
ncbi:MAG TPA: glycosyltransferase family 39 protein [Vicinamibacterales bacterium]|nr:glycosyltransferase family 39 protein [Vicinamibacterales bacterium]